MLVKSYKPVRIFALLATFALGMCVSVTGANGQPLGSEFRVNTYTAGSQRIPKIAFDGLGNAIIVWECNWQDGDGGGIFAQRYDNALLPTGAEFQANTTTVGYQTAPDVSANSSGEFVIAWRNFADEHFFQMYDGTGAPNGDETLVVDWSIDSGGPFVILSDTGDFEVISYIPDNYVQAMIMGLGFDWKGKSCGAPLYLTGDRHSGSRAAGNNAGDVVCLFTIPGEVSHVSLTQVCGTKPPNFPVVAAVGAVDMNATGEFVVVWQAYSFSSSVFDVFAQRYDSVGNPVGVQLVVKQDMPTSLSPCDIALLDDGDFLAVWTELDGEPSETRDVYARRYVASGATLLDEFRVNESPGSLTPNPVVAAAADGRFLVAWAQYTPESNYDVYARVVQPIGTGIGDRSPTVPSHRLTQIYPNPFSHKTAIGYELASPADVTIRIFDVQGRLVTSIQQGHRPDGSYTAEWNGRDSHGRLVSSGTYFCQMTAGEKVFAKKMLVLR